MRENRQFTCRPNESHFASFFSFLVAVYIAMISTFKRCANWNFASLKRTLSSIREDHKVNWTKYAKAMAKAPKSRRAQELIESHGINWETWKAFCSPLCTLFLQNPISFVETHCVGSDVDFNNIFRTHKPSKRSTGRTTPRMEDLFVRSILLPMYYRDENVVDSLEQMSSATDLRAPHEWYPETRSMVRKIVFHCGPTNSGKVLPFNKTNGTFILYSLIHIVDGLDIPCAVPVK